MKLPTQLKALSLAAILGGAMLAACAPPLASAGGSAQANGNPPQNTIAVTGSGVAYGKPDIATVQIGVQSRFPDLSAAISDNTQKAQTLMDLFTSLGIEAKDLQTSNFSVSTQPDYDNTGQPKGTYTYYVDNTLSVTVRELNKLGEVLGKAVDAGANNVYGVSFGVADPAALEGEARAKAMTDAKTRAEQLAQAAGVALGGPVTISEVNVAPPIPYAAPMMRDAVAASAPVPVATGQLQVNLQVTVVYAIK